MLSAHLSDPRLRTGPRAAESAADLHRALGYGLALDPRPGRTVVALESWRSDRSAGRLGEAQLAWLGDVVGRRPEVSALVCSHHPPVAVRRAIAVLFAGTVGFA